MQPKARYFIFLLTLITHPLLPSPTIETPTIIKIKGLEPVNRALDQANQALDKINITVDKLAHVPHMIGIMILGFSFCSWGFHRLQTQETSNNWQQKMANVLLIGSGLLLTITAPVIASKTSRLII